MTSQIKAFRESTAPAAARAVRTAPSWQNTATYWGKGFSGSAMNAKIFRAAGCRAMNSR